MSEDVADIKAAVRRVTGDPRRLAFWGATVVSQGSDGSVDVQLDDGAPLPEASGVQLRLGIPGVRVKVKRGARCRVAFEAGSLLLRFASFFDEDDGDAIESISFAGGTDKVARVTDECDAGTLSVISGPGSVVINYTPPGGAPTPLVTITGQIAGAPGAGPVQLKAKITGPGAAKVFA